MDFLKPPYSKKHIIILASITFFIGIGLLFYYKDTVWKKLAELPLGKTKVENIVAEDLRTDDDLSAGYTLNQLDNTAAAWSEEGTVLLDIRPTKDYQKKHLTGSISAPVEWLDQANIDRSAKVIIYSTDPADLQQAQSILEKIPVKAVYQLSEPLSVLEDQGHTTVGSEKDK